MGCWLKIDPSVLNMDKWWTSECNYFRKCWSSVM